MMSEQPPSPLSVEQFLEYGVPGPQAAEAVITDIDEQLAENNAQYVCMETCRLPRGDMDSI